MAEEEIKTIDSLLQLYKPKHCLEWGSGNSTIYFPKKHKFIKSWLSIEENGNYLDYLRDKCAKSVQTIWILPSDSYPDCVQRSNRKFDFIFIDGYDRDKCLDNSFGILADDGVILLHDSGRIESQRMIQKYGGTKLTDGEEPYQGFYKHRGLHMFVKGDKDHATS